MTKHLLAVLLAGLCLFAAAKQVRAETCPLALVLALDASSSVDAREYRLQAEGLEFAFSDPDVEAAILGVGGILVTAFEWSGRNQHVIHAGWSWLDSKASIAAFARRLGMAQRGFDEFPTALGHALGFAAIQLNRAPLTCTRRVIDVSGDGTNNEGFGPASAYRAHAFDRVTVNGLVIKGADPDPEAYYKSTVIRGAGAFVELTNGYEDYARAMRRKLLREIGGGMFADLGSGTEKLR